MDLFARVDVESIRTVCKDIQQAAVRQQVVALAKKARTSIRLALPHCCMAWPLVTLVWP
jgi:uncharacterized protein YijF (DUF1287 family)